MKDLPPVKPLTNWVFLIAASSIAVHLVAYNALGFHRDELLYLALGRHLDAGFWSNPPLIGFISFLSQLLPLDSLLATRLIPALAGGVLLVIIGLIAAELGGGTFAQVTGGVVFSLSLLMLRAFLMLQPVPFDILFWTLMLYLFLRYVRHQNPKTLLWLGGVTGLGMLNKYMVVFLAAGLAIAVLFTRHRNLMWRRRTLYALILALLLFLPNLIWQYTHGWPVFYHMRELHDTQLIHVNRLGIVVDQFILFGLSGVIWTGGLIWLLFSSAAKSFRVFGYAYLAVLAIFVVTRGKSYYLAGMYPFLFAAGGVAWELLLKKKSMRIVFAVVLALLSLPLFPGGIPFLPARQLAEFYKIVPGKAGNQLLLRWEDGNLHPLPQDFADMLGWDELAGVVISACDSIQQKERILIYADNYGQAGAIDHFGRNHGLPPVICFTDSYLLWAPDSLSGREDMFFYVNEELGTDMVEMFSRIDSIGSITNPFAREYGTSVYLLREPRHNFAAFYAERVRAVKSNRLGN